MMLLGVSNDESKYEAEVDMEETSLARRRKLFIYARVLVYNMGCG